MCIRLWQQTEQKKNNTITRKDTQTQSAFSNTRTKFVRVLLNADCVCVSLRVIVLCFSFVQFAATNVYTHCYTIRIRVLRQHVTLTVTMIKNLK